MHGQTATGGDVVEQCIVGCGFAAAGQIGGQ